MTNRRINPNEQPDRKENKLKAAAGIIKGLSYSEMLRLVNMLHTEMGMDSGKPATNIANALLAVSEQILNEKEVG